MKIYFEDGQLRKPQALNFEYHCKVDASDGFSANQELLDAIKIQNPYSTVYTNSLVALSNEYCWNSELNVPELYIRAGEHLVFIRVDKLTTRELREGHNLEKMYRANEFKNL